MSPAESWTHLGEKQYKEENIIYIGSGKREDSRHDGCKNPIHFFKKTCRFSLLCRYQKIESYSSGLKNEKSLPLSGLWNKSEIDPTTKNQLDR
jgi:hypothetical protein